MIPQYSKKYLFFFLFLLLIKNLGFSQNILINGILIDSEGDPVNAAKVSFYENPDSSTSSDKEGKFSLYGQLGQNLVISISDYYSKVFRITENPVVLLIEQKDEMIPVGFGMMQSQDELTSAIGIVRSTELSASSAMDPANALYGKIAGLSVMENGGVSWNNNPDMFIRGIGTFRDASILVLIDGFERPISSLSTSEIESVVILKDAATLAMYGLRGANGVLLVTTKKGKGKNSISINYEHGITKAFRLPEFLNANGYTKAVNQALKLSDNQAPQYTQADIDTYNSGSSPYLFPDVNWFQESLRDFGNEDKVNITFQGGSQNAKYFTVVNYQNNEGLLGPVNSNQGYNTQYNYGKFNFRTNLDIDVTKSTKLRANIGGNLRNAQGPSATEDEIMGALYSIPAPAFPVKTYNNIWGGTSTYSNNPVAQISATGYSIYHIREIIADIRLEQSLDKITKGLAFEAAVSADNSATIQDTKSRQFEYEQLSVTKDASTGEITDTIEKRYGTNTGLEYNSSLADSWRHGAFLAKIKYAKKLGTNEFNSILLFQQDKLIQLGQFHTFLHQMVAGNVHYSRDRKYFADVAMSYSGTNLLPEGNRWGFFPAISVAWKLSEEDWFSSSNVIGNLKIRASWGLAGSDLIPQNLENPFIYGADYYFGRNNTAAGGIMEGRLSPTNLTYETSNKKNIGIDASLFGIFEFNMDVFQDRRTGILIEDNGKLSNVIGVEKPYQCDGIVDNKGIETGLKFQDKIGDFAYHLNGQLAFVRNKIVDIKEEYRPYEYLNRTGQSVDQQFGLEVIGFYSDSMDISNSPKQKFSPVKPGDIKYKDQNGDGFIDGLDEKPIGFNQINPELYFSGSIGIEYKGFGIDAVFQGVGNHTIYANTASLFWPLKGNNTISTFSRNSWTPETAESASLPRLTVDENVNNYRPNSIWLINGSYLKLRTLNIYYNFSEKLISKVKLANARLYLRGSNLFSIDHFNNVDPEEIRAVYPTLTSYYFGIQIGF